MCVHKIHHLSSMSYINPQLGSLFSHLWSVHSREFGRINGGRTEHRSANSGKKPQSVSSRSSKNLSIVNGGSRHSSSLRSASWWTVRTSTASLKARKMRRIFPLHEPGCTTSVRLGREPLRRRCWTSYPRDYPMKSNMASGGFPLPHHVSSRGADPSS